MVPQQNSHPLGAALEEAYRYTLSAWHDEHGRGRTLTDALAEEVTSVTATLKATRFGKNSVTVTVLCKRPWKSVSEVFRLQREGWDRYIVTESTVTLD